ncbi:hypothetical protein MMC16_006225 [Acarospora aff. strigata]|nr:hypothetical protein [Acarospora aff. strigata]
MDYEGNHVYRTWVQDNGKDGRVVRARDIVFDEVLQAYEELETKANLNTQHPRNETPRKSSLVDHGGDLETPVITIDGSDDPPTDDEEGNYIYYQDEPGFDINAYLIDSFNDDKQDQESTGEEGDSTVASTPQGPGQDAGGGDLEGPGKDNAGGGGEHGTGGTPTRSDYPPAQTDDHTTPPTTSSDDHIIPPTTSGGGGEHETGRTPASQSGCPPAQTDDHITSSATFENAKLEMTDLSPLKHYLGMQIARNRTQKM